MKVLICGDRNWIKIGSIKEVIREIKPDKVIHGSCRGADLIAEQCCKDLGVSFISYPADWEFYGPAAGPIRNLQMLETKPDMVIAFHKDIGKSKGTLHCIREAVKRKIAVRLYNEKGREDVFKYIPSKKKDAQTKLSKPLR